MHMSKVSIRDVAALAGVSTATVSHVINNTRYVKEETKQLVLKSIEELHYSPDATARSFKTGKKNLIAFIVPDISNPFFATMIEEVKMLSPEKASSCSLLIQRKRKSARLTTCEFYPAVLSMVLFWPLRLKTTLIFQESFLPVFLLS